MTLRESGLIFSASLSLFAATAWAQPVIQDSLTPETAAARPPGETRAFKPGMVVLDRHGDRLGVIERVDQSRGEKPAVQVLVNGARYLINNTDLKLSKDGEEAITTLSRSDLRTRAILNTE
jgi:hypothetical protein